MQTLGQIADSRLGNRAENPVLRKANRGNAQHKQHQSIISAQPAGNRVFVQCFRKDLHKCQRAGELSVAVVKSQTVTVKILHSATVKNLTYINRTRRTCFGLNHCFQNVSEVLYQLYTDCSFIP